MSKWNQIALISASPMQQQKRSLRLAGNEFVNEIGLRSQVTRAGSGRNRITATMQSKAETVSTTSCVSLNGDSVWVGASACRAGIFSNDCTTSTKRLKYR